LDLLASSATGGGLFDAIIDLSGYFMTSPSSESWTLTFREEGQPDLLGVSGDESAEGLFLSGQPAGGDADGDGQRDVAVLR
jgi:hypothetical protein